MANCIDLKDPTSTINKIKNGLYGLPGSIDIQSKFMSDRQIAKKILHKKQKKKGRTDDEVDDDLNLIVYGTNIRKKLGASYQKYKSEIDFDDLADRMADELEVGEEGFVPISKDDPIFDEILKLKSRIRNSVYMVKEKGKSLASDIVQLTTLLGASIPAAAALIVTIPIPNIPGALSLILLCLDSLSTFFSKLKDLLPYMDPLADLELVIQLDLIDSVKQIVCAALQFIYDSVILPLQKLTELIKTFLGGKDPETAQSDLAKANDAVKNAKSDLEKTGFYEEQKEAKTKAQELQTTYTPYTSTTLTTNPPSSINGYVIASIKEIWETNYKSNNGNSTEGMADTYVREVKSKLDTYNTTINNAKNLLPNS